MHENVQTSGGLPTLGDNYQVQTESAPAPTYAFRCKNCGHLLEAGHAGEQDLPNKCPVCKAGVVHNPDGTWTRRADNWEVLASCDQSRLEELGLTAEQTVKHTPIPKEKHVRDGVEVCKRGLEHLARKRAGFEKNKDKLIADYREADARVKELTEQIDRAVATRQPFPAHLSNERANLQQRMADLEAQVPSDRDDEYEAHLKTRLAEHEAYLAGKDPARGPQSLKALARDGAGTADRG